MNELNKTKQNMIDFLDSLVIDYFNSSEDVFKLLNIIAIEKKNVLL